MRPAAARPNRPASPRRAPRTPGGPMRRLLIACTLALAPTPWAGAQDPLPAQLLTDLQAPTAFVKVQTGRGAATGTALSTTRGNPAVTVGKGTVSSLREDEAGEVAVVQIDGDINPGNSGGPVVDGQGRLVGIAVAKITGTRIGLAIPPSELTKMLDG